ncbi:MAG: hypothetical protein ABIR94_14995 [Rubrivivax sp.]
MLRWAFLSEAEARERLALAVQMAADRHLPRLAGAAWPASSSRTIVRHLIEWAAHGKG